MTSNLKLLFRFIAAILTRLWPVASTVVQRRGGGGQEEETTAVLYGCLRPSEAESVMEKFCIDVVFVPTE